MILKLKLTLNDEKNLRNLTQSSLRNDPINRRMQGYSFRNFRRRRWSSRCKFSLLFQSNLDLKHSIDAEMSLECSGTNGMRFGVVYKEYFGFDRERVLRCEEHVLKKKTKIDFRRLMTRPSRSTARIMRRLIETTCWFVVVRSLMKGLD